MATLRNDRMAEILTQVAVPKSFFAMVLNLRPDQHRYTYEVMAAALMLSAAAVMQFKHHFRVRRPAERSPLVQAVLLTPGHASYPAGHSTQGHILRSVLTRLVSAKEELDDQLERLADRVGENRIVAGLHFKSDIDAGAKLGAELAAYFVKKSEASRSEKPEGPSSALAWLWAKAKAEWEEQ